MPRRRRTRRLILTLTAVAALAALAAAFTSVQQVLTTRRIVRPSTSPAAVNLNPFQRAVEADLARQVASNIVYQDGYFVGGDPPANIGVCTDVAIRSFRAAGVDLKSMVQEDERAHPSGYKVERRDPNIDHRRCRNLAVFFKHRAQQLPIEGPNADWEPGDIVLWNNGTGVAGHIGIISTHVDEAGIPLVIHHWPGQVVMEQDWLYRLPVLYHFRWKPQVETIGATSFPPHEGHSIPERE